MKSITVIGSTGSIGTQTLEIAAQYPEQFRIVGLAAGNNIELLAQQVQQFHPEIVATCYEDKLPELQTALQGLDYSPQILAGEEGVAEVARYGDAESVVTGIVGCAGLMPTIAAIKAGKNIALANKETLISRRILLTASGGAFRDWPVEKLPEVTVADALKHPNWSMGQKITIDSATLMNKGLEVIEAHYLFGLPYDQIEIVIHPQSIIHSLIELQDTSVLAQLGWPDMRLPLLYALSYPDRLYTNWEPLDLVKAGSLTFNNPDHDKYRCMQLAYAAGREGGLMPAVLNAANEQAVALFLEEKINFLDIPRLIETVCDRASAYNTQSPSLDDILEVNQTARQDVLSAANSLNTVTA